MIHSSLIAPCLVCLWCSTQVSGGPPRTVALYNVSSSDVEFWLDDRSVGAVRPNTVRHVVHESERAEGIAVTGIEHDENVFYINSIVVSTLDSRGPGLSIVWSGIDIPDGAKEMQPEEGDAVPQYGALFERRWESLKRQSHGSPVRFAESLIGTKHRESDVRARALAAHAASTSQVVNSLGMLFVRIPKGEFVMAGSRPPARPSVTLTQDYYMSVTEVTTAQFRFGRGKEIGPIAEQELPAAEVLWDDAVDWSLRATDVQGWRCTLPTEAQWEWAARGPGGGPVSPADRPRHEIMWYGSNSGMRTNRVGSKLPNHFGLFDMHGNVMEWCLDGFNPRRVPAGPDPLMPASTTERVRRGGGFDSPEQWCTSGLRDAGFGREPQPAQGFRCVIERTRESSEE